ARGLGLYCRRGLRKGAAIPFSPPAREGRMTEALLRMLRPNVGEPLQVEGDIYACAACNDEGGRRLIDMMEEFGIANLDRLGDTIIEASLDATLAGIRGVAEGTYRNTPAMAGYSQPLTLKQTPTI